MSPPRVLLCTMLLPQDVLCHHQECFSAPCFSHRMFYVTTKSASLHHASPTGCSMSPPRVLLCTMLLPQDVLCHHQECFSAPCFSHGMFYVTTKSASPTGCSMSPPRVLLCTMLLLQDVLCHHQECFSAPCFSHGMFYVTTKSASLHHASPTGCSVTTKSASLHHASPTDVLCHHQECFSAPCFSHRMFYVTTKSASLHHASPTGCSMSPPRVLLCTMLLPQDVLCHHQECFSAPCFSHRMSYVTTKSASLHHASPTGCSTSPRELAHQKYHNTHPQQIDKKR